MITEEKLLKLMEGQARSAEMWIAGFERYADGASVRNASLAIGKWFGLFNVLTTMNAMEKDVPPEVAATQQRFSDVWDAIQRVPLRPYEEVL